MYAITMHFHIFAFSILLAPLAGARAPGRELSHRSLTVKTTSGTYNGLVNSSAPDVRQWLGIPFGRPPLGARRFMPPERAPDHGARDAKAYKPICMQTGGRTGVFWELVPEFQNQDTQSEDCLYLNIWSPRKPVQKKVPVIIWVCGGGFKEGGGHAPYQVPEQWIQRTQTHIVVTFKYVITRPVHGTVSDVYALNRYLLWLAATVSVSGVSRIHRSQTKTLGSWTSDLCTYPVLGTPQML